MLAHVNREGTLLLYLVMAIWMKVVSHRARPRCRRRKAAELVLVDADVGVLAGRGDTAAATIPPHRKYVHLAPP